MNLLILALTLTSLTTFATTQIELFTTDKYISDDIEYKFDLSTSTPSIVFTSEVDLFGDDESEPELMLSKTLVLEDAIVERVGKFTNIYLPTKDGKTLCGQIKHRRILGDRHFFVNCTFKTITKTTFVTRTTNLDGDDYDFSNIGVRNVPKDQRFRYDVCSSYDEISDEIDYYMCNTSGTRRYYIIENEDDFTYQVKKKIVSWFLVIK